MFNYAFCIFLLTTFTGSIFTVLCLLFRKCQGVRHVRMMDRFLKISIQTYVIPVLFLTVLLRQGDDTIRAGGNGPITHRTFSMSPQMRTVFAVLVCIWAAATALTVLRWLVRTVRMKRALAGSVPEDDAEVLACYERVKQCLGIRRRIPLMRNDLFETAFTVGVFRQKVVLPFGEYGKEELAIIFAHELAHCRRRDLFFKMESVFVNVLHAVNPFAYFVRHFVGEYTEMNCDIFACEHAKELFSAKEYFRVILEQASKEEKEADLVSALTGKPPLLQKRVEAMKAHQRIGAEKRGFAIAMVTAFVVCGSAAAYAVGSLYVKAHQAVYAVTRELHEEYMDDGMAAQVFLPDQVCDDNAVVLEDGITIDGPGAYTMYWEVPANTKCITAPFALDGVEQVVMTVIVPEGCNSVRAGIQYPDGSEQYVEGNNALGYSFTVSDPGEGYRFFLENMGGEAETIEAYYMLY